MKTIVLLLLGCVTAMAQTTWYVDQASLGPGTGTVIDPFLTIQEGLIAAAASGDSVAVMPGTYPEEVDFLGKDVVVGSVFGSAMTTVDGGFLAENGESLAATIDGFRIIESANWYQGLGVWIRNGSSATVTNCEFEALEYSILHSGFGGSITVLNCSFTTGNGANGDYAVSSSNTDVVTIAGCTFDALDLSGCHAAAISVQATAVSVSGCSFTDLNAGTEAMRLFGLLTVASCTSDSGGLVCGGAPGSSVTGLTIQGAGGIWSQTGDLTITSSTLDGSGIVVSGGTVAIDSCQIESASYVGLRVSDGLVTVTDTSISDTITTDDGGGVRVTGGFLTLDRCTIANNSAERGGGVFVSDGGLVATNTILAGNSATTAGGGLYADGGFPVVTNCTLDGNTAPSGGTAFFAVPGSIENSILWNGGNSPVFGIPTLSHCDIEGGWSGPGGDNIDLDPAFVDPATGDLRLQATSPCINQGTVGASFLPMTDHDGMPRVQGGLVDMGAFEFAAPPAALPGSEEDLVLAAAVNGQPSVTAAAAVVPGDLFDLSIVSPLGGFVGFPVILAAQVHPVGAPPVGVTGFPELHLQPSASIVIYDSTLPSPFGPGGLGLPAAGLTFQFPVTQTLPGFVSRWQAFAVTPLAANGYFAASVGHDVAMP